MGLKDTVNALIDANIYANGEEKITGQGLNATLKSVVEMLPTTDEILTGINGTATESNAPNTGAGFFRYIVTEPITTGSAWGIEVTQAELDDNWVFFNVKDGVITKDNKPNLSGRGITSISKTSTVGLVDTYAITFTDSTTTTFEVTNGEIVPVLQTTGTSETSTMSQKAVTDLLSAGGESPTVVQDIANFNVPQPDDIYISGEVLKEGWVRINVKVSADKPNASFYLVEKTGTTYKVLQKSTHNLTAGINVIDTGFYSENKGNQFFAIDAPVTMNYFNGVGFYINSSGLEYNVNDTFTFNTDYSYQGYGIAYYYEYFPKLLNAKFSELETGLNNAKNDISALSNQLPKLDLAVDFPLLKYTNIAGQVGFTGRWFDKTIGADNLKVTINAGSEIHFKVKGATTVNVNFVVITSLATPFFAYSIDGAPLVRQLITNPTLPAISAGEHIIRIVCDGLSPSENSKWYDGKGFAFKNVTVNAGTVTGVLPKNRSVIFFGDSITEGFRVLNTDSDSNGLSASKAFSYLASKKLKSTPTIVGFSSTGITVGGSGNVPKFVEILDWAASGVALDYVDADCIVINHGTNDAGASEATFIADYNAALSRINILYPGIPVFLMIPFNQTKAAEIQTIATENPQTHLIETAGWGLTTTDGGHPDVAGAEKAAQKTADAILSVMGKSFFL